MKYIVNGKIVLPNKILTNGAIGFNKKIVEVINIKDVPKNAEIIDAKGCYVCPGLIDIHIHGYLGADTCDGKTKSIRTIANGIMKNGVTSWCPTIRNVSIEEINTAVNMIRSLKPSSENWCGAEILGVNLECSGVDSEFIRKNMDIVSTHFKGLDGCEKDTVKMSACNNDNNYLIGLICDKFHQYEKLFGSMENKKSNQYILITDCTRAGGMSDRGYTLDDGAITGSVLKLNTAIKNVRDNTDLSLWTIINAASLNPAKAIGVDDRKGSLEVGKDADIIIADRNFNIMKTIVGGKIKFKV